MKIRVPATTANMGPGFDCIGMALSLYNEVEVQVAETGEGLRIQASEGVPTGPDNLIYKTLCDFYREAGLPLPPLPLVQKDRIPMTRGLGSSAACVVAGLLAGNALAGTGLSREALIDQAAKIEGHPDNTTPALTGGLVVGVMDGARLSYIRIPPPTWERLRFALMVPAFELSTEKARQALPDAYPRRDVVHNTSRAALLVAALATGDFEKLAVALDDCVHQPYRLPLVPGMDAIFAEARNCGAYNAFLSGAGPALIAVTQDDDFLPRMEAFLQSLPHRWDICWIEPDHHGAMIL